MKLFFLGEKIFYRKRNIFVKPEEHSPGSVSKKKNNQNNSGLGNDNILCLFSR